jgi:hypothetical protein
VQNHSIMKTIPFLATLITIVLLTASTSFSETKSTIEGVWKLTEWIESGDTNTHTQPGLFIFTKRYYSVAMVMAPRGELKQPERGRQLSDSEKIERFEYWKWFVGASGTYEFKEMTVVMHPVVTKDAFDMKTGESEIKFQDSNTIWLIPAAAKKVGLRMKLTRVE